MKFKSISATFPGVEYTLEMWHDPTAKKIYIAVFDFQVRGLEIYDEDEHTMAISAFHTRLLSTDVTVPSPFSKKED